MGLLAINQLSKQKYQRLRQETFIYFHKEKRPIRYEHNKQQIFRLGEPSLKKKREKLGKIPKGGRGLKIQTKIPNFNLGILKTQGGGLDFSKMSEL